LFEWIESNGNLLIVMTAVSAVLLVVSLVVVGIVVVRLPADYFDKDKRAHEWEEKNWRRRHPAVRLALRIGRNVLGWGLIAAGLAMLVLPGQGLLVLLIGVMLAEFPGKYRVERWIISRRKISKSINWLRKKFDREPLRIPRRNPARQPAGTSAGRATG
jgi:hypothetical protein